MILEIPMDLHMQHKCCYEYNSSTSYQGHDIMATNSLQWRHNGCDIVSHHQPHECLLNRLFRRRSGKASTLRVTGLCAGNQSPVTGEFPAQMASNAGNVFIRWRHHIMLFRRKWCNSFIYLFSNQIFRSLNINAGVYIFIFESNIPFPEYKRRRLYIYFRIKYPVPWI